MSAEEAAASEPQGARRCTRPQVGDGRLAGLVVSRQRSGDVLLSAPGKI